MRNAANTLGTSSRSLALMEAVVEDGGRSNLSDIARRVAMPIPTAHRQAASLVAHGFLVPVGRGLHIAGPRLRRLSAMVEDKQIIAACAAPLLRKLAARFSCVAQLGTLENDMVTYRVKTGRGAGHLFTRTDMQLEAYCSGLGKALLAFLPVAELEVYIANGPFIPLTPNTITDGAALRTELAKVRDQGFAEDRGEILPDLSCIAVPIRQPGGGVAAAISVSRPMPSPEKTNAIVRKSTHLLANLRETARTIEDIAYPLALP